MDQLQSRRNVFIHWLKITSSFDFYVKSKIMMSFLNAPIRIFMMEYQINQ